MHEPEGVYAPPELAVDLGSVPTDLVVFSDEGSQQRSIAVWAICGQPPPIVFSDVCGASLPSGVALPQHSARQCVNEPDACAVSMLEHTSATLEPLVSLIRRDTLACASDDASSCSEILCSLSAIAEGRCPTSRQSFTMHAFHASRVASQQLEVESSVQSLQVLTTFVPSLGQASVAAVVEVGLPASANLASSAHGQAMQSLAAHAVGPVRCSAVAAVLHDALRVHLQSFSACQSLAADSGAGVSGDAVASGRLVALLEVVSAREDDALLLDGSGLDGGTSTVVGSLALNASVSLGVDVGTAAAPAVTSLRSTAAACLAAWEASAPRPVALSFPVSEVGGSTDGGGAADIPLETDSGERLSMVVTNLAVAAVAASEAACPVVTAAELAHDELVSHFEQAVMQQHMMDLAVCATLLRSFCAYRSSFANGACALTPVELKWIKQCQRLSLSPCSVLKW